MISAGPQWSHWSEQIRGERPSDDPRRLELWGYAGRPSYAPGETLTLHVSTTARAFALAIYRDGAARELVHEATSIPGALHLTPPDAYAAGCGWPAAIELVIPDGWRPGGYVVELSAADERGRVVHDGFFVVRSAQPGRDAAIAVVLATYTWQAYNDWGGGSAYSRDPAPDTTTTTDHGIALREGAGFAPRLALERPWARGLIRVPRGAPRMTLRRPPEPGWAPRHEYSEWALANGFSHWSGCAGWAHYDAHFVRWAERQGYAVELLTQWDLDRDPACLDAYACVVTVGHDEYWTAAGRRALDGFIERGGRYARLAGNIVWQVRLEDGGRTQVCHKYAPGGDPLAGAEDRGLRTGPFDGPSIADPPVTTFGASGAYGGYARFGASSPRGVGGFVVYRNDHWAFAGTDLYYGDVIGAAATLVGYETDGVAYTVKDGLPLPTGADGAPPDLEILALTPVTVEEEDHGHPGGVIFTGDGDLAFLTQMLFGADTPAGRDRVRRRAAVMTWMPKGRGEVFCGGATEWPYALAEGDATVERIVRNVLDRYSVRH